MSENQWTLYQMQQIVLGTMMCSKVPLGHAISELSEDCFTTDATKTVFLVIRGLFLAGEPVNAVTVLSECGDDYKDFLLGLVEWAQNEIDYYVKKLRDMAMLNAMQKAAYDILDATSPEAAARQISRLNEISAARSSSRVISLQESVQQYMDSIGKRKPEFIKTGIQELDSEVFLRKGKFVVIGAYASAGKTLLALDLAKEMGKKYKVGFFSCETDAADITTRMLTTESRIFNRKILQQDLNAADIAGLQQAQNALSFSQVDIIEAGGYSVADVQAVALTNRYDIVFVDYLQLLRGSGRGRYEDVTEISLGLHTMAQQHKVLVIALAQLSRPEKKDGKPVPPGMSSLRESGQIEQDADVVILMWPESPDDNRSDRILKVSKNKEGGKLSMKLSFDGATQTMRPARMHFAGKRRSHINKAGLDGNPTGFSEVDDEPPENFKQEAMAF